MPFRDGGYYPYTSETQGTHSSAGIPSILNSPLSHHSVPAPGMTPSSGGATVFPFKFRPRREIVDWQKLSAVDIDMVTSQLDVDTLQEYVSMVTFCTLDGERCQRCRSPLDQALVNLLRLAQLTVEWLLHCQDFLSLKLRTAEEQLAAYGKERDQMLSQQKKQEENLMMLNTEHEGKVKMLMAEHEGTVKMLKAELKQRKKIIRDQQFLITPRIIGSHKCLHCDKSFMSSSYLQSHIQRRHPEEFEIQLRSNSENKSEIDSLKQEINSLKEETVQLQQALQAKTIQEKELQSMHKDLLRDLDRFKAEEMARMDRKIEDSRDNMRREMEHLYNRNIQAHNDTNQKQTTEHEKPANPVYSQGERDLDRNRAIQRLEQQLKKQDKKWESRLQKIKVLHESEKNEWLNSMSKMQLSMSENQEHSKRLQQDMSRRLQEKEQTIRAQREQIKNASLNQPTKIVEVPVTISSSAQEPKSKRAGPDLSSISERRPVEKKSHPKPEKKHKVNINDLRRNPSVKREVRQELEQTLITKLEKLSVNPGQNGLKNKKFTSILAKLNSKRDSFSKDMPDYWRHHEEIVRTVEEKLAHNRRGSEPASKAQDQSRSVEVLQIRPRSSSLPSKVTQVTSGPAIKQPKTPQPAPRTKTTIQPTTSTPNNKTTLRTFATKTPPFSSDEESSEEDSDMESEKDVRGKSMQFRPNQAPSVQNPANTASQIQDRWPQVRHSFSSNPQQSWGSVGAMTKTTVRKVESDDDDDDNSSEVSELQEIDPRQLQSNKDQNSNVVKKNVGKENKVNDLARKMERMFSERVVKKPAGAVSILGERKDMVQELTYSDLEDNSDWVVSSLEERQEVSKPAQSSAPLRRSLDSQSTSVWGTSTGKGPKSGLTEAGTGSTLKSSLCSLSDISDSEDNSFK